MFEFFGKLLDDYGFMPHGHCYFWEPSVLWTHVIGDVLTAIAYFSIPVGIWIFVKKRTDLLLRYKQIFLLFGAFIFTCGLTHAIDVYTIWIPTYRLESLAKLGTGSISILTAVVFFRLIPEALNIPTTHAFRKVKDKADQSEIAITQLKDYAIIFLDTEGNICNWNKVAAKMKGYEAEEVIGKNVSIFYTDEDQFNGKAEKLLAAAIRKGREEDKGLFQRKDGTLFWGSVSVVALQELNNNLSGFSYIIHDLSEIKRLEVQLDRNTDLMNLGFDVWGMGTWEWDITHDKFIWGKGIERVYGWEPGELPDSYEGFAEHVYTFDREKIIKANEHAITHLDHYEGNYRILRKDTKQLGWVSFKSKFFRDEQGQAYLMRGVAWDSTNEALQIKNKALRLEHQNRELKQFAYIASHDLQGPLQTVTNYVEILLEDYMDQLDEHAEHCLAVIANASLRMQNLIKDLLEHSRLGQKKELVKVDLNDAVQQVLQDLSRQISEAQAKLRIEDLPVVCGYETELTLLFQNLISNAIKFRRKGVIPDILISVERDQDQWKFMVKDNGIGIAADHHVRIFEIFTRLHNKEDFDGTGIGLANCLKIVALHDGKIWVDSVPGYGSTFYFTIPIEDN